MMAKQASQHLQISPSKKHTKGNSWIDCIIPETPLSEIQSALNSK